MLVNLLPAFLDVIAAEDTRRTARLLQHYSISTRTTSLHEHNEREAAVRIAARLAAGERIAYVCRKCGEEKLP